MHFVYEFLRPPTRWAESQEIGILRKTIFKYARKQKGFSLVLIGILINVIIPWIAMFVFDRLSLIILNISRTSVYFKSEIIGF
jgi:hypothetical protein